MSLHTRYVVSQKTAVRGSLVHTRKVHTDYVGLNLPIVGGGGGGGCTALNAVGGGGGGGCIALNTVGGGGGGCVTIIASYAQKKQANVSITRIVCNTA